MQEKKRTGGASKGGGQKRSRATKPKAPDKLEPAPKPEEEVAPKVTSPVMPFPSVKPDCIRMFCNRCGHRMTLRSQNPGTPGLGPYQGYCRRPSCMVEYVVQVNPIG